MRCAALNTGPDFHLLDHIAPLCAQMEIPLFIEEEKNFSLAKTYYPMVETHYIPDIEYRLGEIASSFEVLFECKYWDPQLKKIFAELYQKNILLLFCAHGQSDKGYSAPVLRHYALQDGALVYGALLQDMLRELKIRSNFVQTGNVRLFFYKKHKQFYDAIVQREVFSRLNAQNKTVLYAPTWKDSDEATTFFQSIPNLLSSLPDSWNLIVKVHPLLEQRNPEQYYRVEALLEGRPNVLLLAEFPLIYPLLSLVDVYLGDYSSVGYDFLAFQRPMFFLLHPHLPRGRLHMCGVVLERPEDLFREIEKNQGFQEAQKSLYAYAFEKTILLLEEAKQREFLDHKYRELREGPRVHRDGRPIWEELPALRYPPASREEIRHQIQLLLKDRPSAIELPRVLSSPLCPGIQN